MFNYLKESRGNPKTKNMKMQTCRGMCLFVKENNKKKKLQLEKDKSWGHGPWIYGFIFLGELHLSPPKFCVITLDTLQFIHNTLTTLITNRNKHRLSDMRFVHFALFIHSSSSSASTETPESHRL